jgi:hypothetical protein
MGRTRAARHHVLVALGLVIASACASGGPAGSSRNPDLITRDQFNEVEQHAYGIISRLRPAWLRARTQETINISEPAFAQVFVDDVPQGDVDALYNIPPGQIDRIEYMSALDATTRFGTGFAGGLIIVRTINSAR